MESDKSVYQMFKYGPLFIGLLFILGNIYSLLFPENSTFNGQPGPPDVYTAAILVLVGLLFVVLFFSFKDYYALAKIGNQQVELRKGEEKIEVNWTEVEYLKIVPFVFPPLYKIKLRDQDDFFLFNTGKSGVNALGLTIDWSEMGGLIQKKKRELDL
jgi:hypothetical protein